MYLVCECGSDFRGDNRYETAKEHVVAMHLDMVENRFADLLDFDDAEFEESGYTRGEEQIYEDAIEEVTDELMDALYDDED